ncbi:MAG: hypothetical protein GYB68_02575 [Chloroflexi bacterium]|nr:hypothetical protein [Chloroflexota bacterium]
MKHPLLIISLTLALAALACGPALDFVNDSESAPPAIDIPNVDGGGLVIPDGELASIDSLCEQLDSGLLVEALGSNYEIVVDSWTETGGGCTIDGSANGTFIAINSVYSGPVSETVYQTLVDAMGRGEEIEGSWTAANVVAIDDQTDSLQFWMNDFTGTIQARNVPRSGLINLLEDIAALLNR